VKDAAGNVTEVHCTYDPATKGGDSPDRRKVKSTIHWVSARHAADAEVRLYEHLFRTEDPEDVPPGQDWKANLNPKSLEAVSGAKVEPSLRDATAGEKYQFERIGYFSVDPDSRPGKQVFNRAVSLKDSWAKEAQKAPKP
jgi:glutaminyl-tRNA synthetase